MKPIGMRNGKKGRRKKQKKKKIERWNGKYKKFKVSKHVHWSLTFMSMYVNILQDAWLFNIVC